LITPRTLEAKLLMNFLSNDSMERKIILASPKVKNFVNFLERD
jgi:hypothetical protein